MSISPIRIGAPYPGLVYEQAPRNVYWEMTQACDLACQHCRADAKTGRDPKELTTEEGKAASGYGAAGRRSPTNETRDARHPCLELLIPALFMLPVIAAAATSLLDGLLGKRAALVSVVGTVATFALATLAFDYPPRAELFRRELEALFLLAREQGRDPASYYGSFAGALGYPQFLPSSMRAYALDFDHSGAIDFESDPIDAIGSVANYLRAHGWQAGAPVAERARLSPATDTASLVAAGIEPTLAPAVLADNGVTTADGRTAAAVATLVDLETPGSGTEYWLGYRNFYVITRYNRSSFYAMSVFELAEALRLGRLVEEIRAERR